jgi:putative DNA primase/helicase
VSDENGKNEKTDKDEKEKKRSPVQILLDCVKGQTYCWHTEDGEPYVDIKGGVGRITHPAGSDKLRAWLRQRFVGVFGGHPTRYILDEAVAALRDLSIDGRTHKAYNRLAPFGEAVFYDLGNSLNQAIRITEEGWQLTTDVPVRFLRGAGALLQVTPVSDGKLPDLLRGFMPQLTETQLALVVGWLVGCFKPGGPFPVLIITGEQGSAKSTFTRVLRRLVDPHSRDMREPPRDPRDLVAAVRHSYVVAFDNVSYLTNDMSDRLCALSTGTRAIGGRALFTDHDEAAFTAVRPLILNGITDFVERGDLADRAISIHLPAIPPDKRVDDDTFWEGFNAAVPAIMGAIFDCVVMALRRQDDVVLTEKPRMANFAKWVVAAEPAMTFPDGTFLKAMMSNRTDSAVRTFAQDAVGSALLDLMAEIEHFEGDVRDIMNRLAKCAAVSRKGWPESERIMASRLRELIGGARLAGIDITELRADAKTRRKRFAISRRLGGDRR